MANKKLVKTLLLLLITTHTHIYSSDLNIPSYLPLAHQSLLTGYSSIMIMRFREHKGAHIYGDAEASI